MERPTSPLSTPYVHGKRNTGGQYGGRARFADDGEVHLDASGETSLQMDDAPDNPSTGSTVLASLWQQSLVGIRVDRVINWKRARASAVAFIEGVAYV
jgi:hypothetical protein